MKVGKILRILAAISIIVWLNACSISQQKDSDCVFDPGYFTIARYEANSLTEYIHWIDQSMEAVIITPSSELVRIKHWACNHIGLEATMYLEGTYFSETQLKQKLNMLARICIEHNEIEVVLKEISRANIPTRSDYDIIIPTNIYSEFYAAIERSISVTILKIKYYRD
ncbi:MAG: hypothetical protein GY737_06190 [Desulfobacteraceae bacterium]|nr:hypothetical protein [Desulfobacteraceae bacterium]